MAIRIQRLTCNVTVHAPPSSSPMVERIIESRDLPTNASAFSIPALQRTLEAGDSAEHEKPPDTGSKDSKTGAVDPRKLADQVYRLMLEDLKIARERE